MDQEEEPQSQFEQIEQVRNHNQQLFVQRDDEVQIHRFQKERAESILHRGSMVQEEMTQLGNLEELEELSGVTTKFEEEAIQMKQRLNKLEVQSQKSGNIPPVIKTCFQYLKKLVFEENPDFDRQENIEQSIMETTKLVNAETREMTKFKVEYFSVSEQVVNKDLNFLRLSSVKSLVAKLAKIEEKLDRVEVNSGEAMEALQDLKERYEGFEQNLFKGKNAQIGQISQQCDLILKDIDETKEKVSDQLGLCQEMTSSMHVLTKEQRQLLSEINLSISRAERRFLKACKNLNAQVHQKAFINQKEQLCEEIVVKMKAQEVKNMLSSTKQLEELIECSKSVAQQQAKFEMILEEMKSIWAEVKGILQKIQDFNSIFQNGLKDEFEQLASKIQKKGEALGQSLKEQENRLDVYELKIADMNIADSDLLQVSKEFNKQRQMINLIQGQLDSVLEGLENVSNQLEMRPNQLVTADEIHQTKHSFKQVERFESTDLPRIMQGIDNLEAFVLKCLKNQLNDNNKKSQNQIGKMKKSFEDLQKLIEALNVKYGDCRVMIEHFGEQFDNEDLERVNQLQMVDERLNEEELNIYGAQPEGGAEGTNESEGQDIDVSNQSGESVQKIKKEIISKINTLVSLFNENNKQIKEQNKQVKTEKVLNELVSKNLLIQEDCSQISDRIGEAKDLCKDIEERLDMAVNQEMIDDLVKKFKRKNDQISECELLQSKAVSQMERIDQLITKQTLQIQDIDSKLDKVNPLNNPSSSKDQSPEFVGQVNSKLEEKEQLKDELQALKAKQDGFIDQIEKVMEPLTLLGEKEVKHEPEVVQIYEKMLNIESELASLEGVLMPNNQKILKLIKSIKAMLDNEMKCKQRKGHQTIEELNAAIEEAKELKDNTFKRVKYYQDLINKAMKKNAQSDNLLNEKLVELSDETFIFEKDLSEADAKLKEQAKRRNDAKKAVQDIEKEPEKFLPHQLDNMLLALEEIQDKLGNTREKVMNTEKTVEQKIVDLQKLLEKSESQKEMLAQIDELAAEIGEDIDNLISLLGVIPVEADNLDKALIQMNKATAAGDDYHEMKDEILKHLEVIQEVRDDHQRMHEAAKVLKNNKEGYKAQLKKSQGIENLNKIRENLQKQKDSVQNIMTDAHEVKETLDELKSKIGDCEIQTNIAKRKNELSLFAVKLDRMSKEFQNLKRAYEKSSETAPEVKASMKEVEERLLDFATQKKEHESFLLSELETIKPVDLYDIIKNHQALQKVRNLKDKIQESEESIKEVEAVQKDFLRKLTEKDMENSIELLGLKGQQLNERLTLAEKKLKRISKSGEEMDGNTSNNEEEEFIFALKKEMPEVFENIQTTFALLGEIDRLVTEVKYSKDSEIMLSLQDKGDIASENVEEAETLLNQLEKEILEWNAQKKLQRRDLQLESIHEQCQNLLEELNTEKINTEVEIEKNLEKQNENRDQEMVDKDGNKVDIMDDLVRLEGSMKAYLKEVQGIVADLKTLENFYNNCFDEFTADLPKALLDLRKMRQKSTQNKNLKRPAQFLKPADKKKAVVKEEENEQNSEVYELIHVSCKYKQRIQNLLSQLNEIKSGRKNLEEKYSEMRKEVFKFKNIKLYKPVKGDVVDEMFAGYLNKAQLQIDVQRISASNYMFGTKKILAKIINGKLVIRVGGGYMNAEEFIDQYGKIEMMKMIRMEENKHVIDNIAALAGKAGNPLNQPRNSVRPGTGLGLALGQEIKEKMRQTLVNVQAYQTHKTNDDGALHQSLKQSYKAQAKIGKPRQSMQIDMQNDLKTALEGMRQTNQKSTRQSNVETPNQPRRTTMLSTPSKATLGGRTKASSPTEERKSVTTAPQVAQTTKNTTASKIGFGYKKNLAEKEKQEKN